jgi:hypothetical protein
VPIPVATVDDQIYHQCPSMVIATVDKFARLAFEPKAAAIFGNVTHYHGRWGYYREGVPPSSGTALPDSVRPHPPGRTARQPLHVQVQGFEPPDLVLQDELHLIEGALGGMVGIYEAAIDILSTTDRGGTLVGPKYVASSATVRKAGEQVQALFARELETFPPFAVDADDRFFSVASRSPANPSDAELPGRLYVGVCAPGRGPQTPVVRILSSLLQHSAEAWNTSPDQENDQFFTVVGYFNAIRELAAALSLYRQDIPSWMDFLYGSDARSLEEAVELSSRVASLDLPMLLDKLATAAPRAPDAVFATSMFGTGVDIDRLGLMVVNGQPKTTSSYIQATGRVGRRSGGLVVTFLRASRPRDLDHYEFFTGYHQALQLFVEPISVTPFAPRARDNTLGPVAVTLLRNSRTLEGQQVAPEWRIQQRLSGEYYAEALRMRDHRHDPEVELLPALLEARSQLQPEGRRPEPGVTSMEMASELDRWRMLAAQHSDADRFVYSEPAAFRPPERDVVLGDHQHAANDLREAFENAPQSLRDVEDTTGFRV